MSDAGTEPSKRPDTRVQVHITDELKESARHILRCISAIEWEEISGRKVCLRLNFESVEERARFGVAFERLLQSMGCSNPSCWRIDGASILEDGEKLADRLEEQDPFTTWFCTRLNATVMEQAKSRKKGKLLPQEFQKQSAKDLSELVKGPLLYSEQTFCKVKLSGETAALLDANPTGDELVALNWMLLSDALPGIVTPPPKEAMISAEDFFEVVTGLQKLADRIAKTGHNSLLVEPVELDCCQLYEKAVPGSNYSFIDFVVEGEFGYEPTTNDCAADLKNLLQACDQLANAAQKSNEPEAIHNISMEFSEAAGLAIQCDGKELHLGNSAKRCLLTLAVLNNRNFRTSDFDQLYSAREVLPSKHADAKAFDNAGTALQKELGHFCWDSSDSKVRTIRGIKWGKLPDCEILRDQIKLLAPVNS